MKSNIETDANSHASSKIAADGFHNVYDEDETFTATYKSNTH